MAEQVKATRAELIKLKKRIILAKSGHRLLKKKRDGLVMEFFTLLAKAKTVREELDKAYIESKGKMDVARVLEGDVRVRSVALAVREEPEVVVSTKNIIGVAVPKITGNTPHQIRSFFDSIAITEAAENYEHLLDKILFAAEIETAIRKLLVEIEKTKRRVNALEFEVIPTMNRQKNLILLRLDELERENFYRLKISKKKIAEQTA